jgi:hypothetical protein
VRLGVPTGLLTLVSPPGASLTDTVGITRSRVRNVLTMQKRSRGLTCPGDATSQLLSSPPPHHAMGRRHASASDGCRTSKWCPRTWQLRTRIKICRLGPEQRMCPCRVARACGERFSLAGFESHVASADGGTHAQCGCIGLLCTPPPPAAAALTSVRSVPWDR